VGLFKQKTVKEQVGNIKELQVDSKEITAIKKQLTSAKTSISKAESRKSSIMAELDSLKYATEKFTVTSLGIDAVMQNIQNFITKKNRNNSDDLIFEYEQLDNWIVEYSKEKLVEVRERYLPLLEDTEKNVELIQSTFETTNNTEEIDNIISEVIEPLEEVVEQFNSISRATNNRLTLNLPRRMSIADKQQKERSDREWLLRENIRQQAEIDLKEKRLGY